MNDRAEPFIQQTEAMVSKLFPVDNGWCDDGKHVVEAGMTHCICGILQLGATVEELAERRLEAHD